MQLNITCHHFAWVNDDLLPLVPHPLQHAKKKVQFTHFYYKKHQNKKDNHCVWSVRDVCLKNIHLYSSTVNNHSNGLLWLWWTWVLINHWGVKAEKKGVTICFHYPACNMPGVCDEPVGMPRAALSATACLSASTQTQLHMLLLNSQPCSSETSGGLHEGPLRSCKEEKHPNSSLGFIVNTVIL